MASSFISQRILAVDTEMAKLGDSGITLAATILGFSLIFLTKDNVTFQYTAALKACWIVLAISMATGIGSRLAGWAKDIKYNAHLVELEGALLRGESPPPVPSHRRDISLFIYAACLTLSVFLLAVGLSLLLVFGYANLK